MLLEKVSSSIWVFHHKDFCFLSKLKVGTRMAVIKLSNNDLMVYSPTPCTSELKEEVSKIGEVKYIVCPNLFHHLFAKEWLDNFPDAKLIASKQLSKKRPDLKIDFFLEDNLPEQITNDFMTMSISSMLYETVFFHKNDKVLITSDILENFKGSDDFWTSIYLKTFKIEKRLTWPAPLRMVYAFSFSKAREQFNTILNWPIEKIILAHGDEIIKSNGQQALRQSLHWIL